MTWSALALFLARRTEFAFNIGHFLTITPFHSLLATFQVYVLSLHGLQDVEITALTWETGRKIPYLRFPCIILYIIGLWSMKLQNEKKSICSESRKKDTKTSTKRHELNGMTQNELFDIFSNAQA